MVLERRKFDVANLTEEEKTQRREGIEFLFNELHRRDTNFTIADAEELYDKMQQVAIDNNKSAWDFYK